MTGRGGGELELGASWRLLSDLTPKYFSGGLSPRAPISSPNAI